ncbi:MAG: NAD(P)H-hydrate dehydratase, partial [Ramlibacter sp.]
KDPVVTWSGQEARAPADARASLHRARALNVRISDQVPPHWELAIDAMLGLGAGRPLEGLLAEWSVVMAGAGERPVLAVDLPSGLNADTGNGPAAIATHTLSLLTLKPGLFTAAGRDAAGEIWLDDLGCVGSMSACSALLAAAPPPGLRPHASHKGSYGDVAVIGGAAGMGGAVLLAATAALHAGAGRVFACLLAGPGLPYDPAQPGLMFRSWESLELGSMVVACGCGGGDAVRSVLPAVLSKTGALVLDADALNAIAGDTQLQTLLQARARRGRATVITPHPLEAGRLLGYSAAAVQADRLAASKELVGRFGCVVALKGSGTVTAGPGQVPRINPTGNARLATAGTGDVLAGLIAARLAAGSTAFDASADAVYAHGRAADLWPANRALTAFDLAGRAG